MNEPTINRSNNSDEFIGFIKFVALVLFALAAALALVYGLLLGLTAGAIWLGVKTGCAITSGSFSPPPYEQVKQFEKRKKIHLKNLEGESEEVRELAERSFEDLKIQAYRPKEEQRSGATRLLEFIRAARQFFKE